jgi:hypothetical protein
MAMKGLYYSQFQASPTQDNVLVQATKETRCLRLAIKFYSAYRGRISCDVTVQRTSSNCIIVQ